jgi:prolyl-tRNA editing enzyme YbaK/EbsC (Cys-tRNA(Pro) deacylase)
VTVHRTAARVQAALRAQGCAAEVIDVPDSTRTAAEAAAALGTSVAQIVKSLVFVAADTSDAPALGHGRPVLVLTSGINRVSTAKLRAIVGGRIARPDADTVRRLTGYAIGGIPPLAHDTPARVLMDPHLLAYPMVWAAAGTPHAVFGIAPAELQRITAAEVCDVTESTSA